MSAQKQINLAKCKAISRLQKDLVKVQGLGKRVHEWQSEDQNRKKFLTTWPGGPKWDKVISRTTYDMETGRIIEHLEIDKRTNACATQKTAIGCNMD